MMATGQNLSAKKGIRMLERRALVVLMMISALSACAATEEFSFENIYDEVVTLLSDDSNSSVTDGSNESVNLEEDSAPGVVLGDDEPARWLIKNGCSLESVTVEAEGTRTWKMRCPDSRWVTLTENSL